MELSNNHVKVIVLLIGAVLLLCKRNITGYTTIVAIMFPNPKLQLVVGILAGVVSSTLFLKKLSLIK